MGSRSKPFVFYFAGWWFQRSKGPKRKYPRPPRVQAIRSRKGSRAKGD